MASRTCGFAGIRVLVEQVLGGQQLRRRAVAALDGAAGHKLLLKRVQIFIARAAHPLDGDDGRAVGLGRQHHAAVDQAVAAGRVRLSGQQHGIGAALAGLVAMFDAEVAQAAQRGAQQFAGVTSISWSFPLTDRWICIVASLQFLSRAARGNRQTPIFPRELGSKEDVGVSRWILLATAR